MALLEIRGLKKSYALPEGGRALVVDVAELALERGAELALHGPSGSGKTTLLDLVAGIQVPDAGKILIDGEDVTALPESGRDRLRAQKVGYVFQSSMLLQGYTALENVLLGMSFGPGPDAGRARELLARVGLADRLQHRPRQLSVGQRQRVALARAVASRPLLLLADEPTGALDPARAADALALLREVSAESGAALVVASHDRELLASFARTANIEELGAGAAGVRGGEGAR